VTAVEQIEPRRWRATLATACEGGARFAGAWATLRDGALAWRALLVGRHDARVLTCAMPAKRVDTIVDLIEAAAWDEREAHDLHGVEFTGHTPIRALAAHTDDLASWVTPVTGDGVHQVAVGPIHAGVIESGHFRFHVVGERILAMDPRLFYKHRGLERAAEGKPVDDALRYVARSCAACTVANTLAYAHAVEDAQGLLPDGALRRNRAVLLELERLYNHLHDISAICAGVGYAPGAMAFAALKDRAQQLCVAAFGHRFLFATIAIGRGAVALSARATDDAAGGLRELHHDAALAWRELEFVTSLQARLNGVGVLSAAGAVRLGAVGPAARASGIAEDLRTHSPRLAYQGFVAAHLPDAAGDVAARLGMRALELQSTCDVLDDLLATPLAAGVVAASAPPAPIGIGRVESSRGATMCAVELSHEHVTRVHLRSASYANWPALAHASAGSLLPDFPLINKSFELCYACVDR
jgi:Ni,Fe-hydrogenase III large subunit